MEGESGTYTDGDRPGLRVFVSPNKRYFLDSNGRPWFFVGDTLWELFRMYSPEEAREILDTRIAQGFNAFLVMLNGVPEGGNGGMPGTRPWQNGRPPELDESYFARVDSVVTLCSEYDALFVVGVYHKAESNLFSPASAREYARRVASRYRKVPNIVWCMYPEAQEEYRSICREIAAGLADGDDGSHLITIHPDPAPTSSSFFGNEPWIAFNMLQVCIGYDRIPEMVRADYDFLPTRPAIMAEGGYEGIEFGSTQTPRDIRKQAYWSHASGGYHVYGHNDNYASPKTWRSWLHADGARQLGVFRRSVTDFKRWWTWVPDQSIIPGSAGTRTGAKSDAGMQRYGETRSYTTPDGWEDAVIGLKERSVSAPGQPRSLTEGMRQG